MTESETSPLAYATARLEIDLGAIVANWRDLARRHDGEVAAVVKANAYGLGAERVAPALLEGGCRHFFTAHLSEALALRPLLPGVMLAALNGAPAGSEEICLENDLWPVLVSLDDIARWQATARRVGRKLPVILHVDTGMNRLGLDLPELSVLAAEPARLAGLDLRYVMTHLVAAEVADSPSNGAQQARFAEACAALPDAPRCLANSSGIFLGPDFASDLARPGAALFGINPTPGRTSPMRLPMRLLAQILQVRTIGIGEGVGYNSVWRAGRASRIATLGIGYADGWRRRFAGQKVMAWAGPGRGFDERPIPLVGRVSMDLTTCDVTDHPELRPGHWLELMGPRQTPDALGAMAGTIGYEILTGLGPRIQRVYAP